MKKMNMTLLLLLKGCLFTLTIQSHLSPRKSTKDNFMNTADTGLTAEDSTLRLTFLKTKGLSIRQFDYLFLSV